MIRGDGAEQGSGPSRTRPELGNVSLGLLWLGAWALATFAARNPPMKQTPTACFPYFAAFPHLDETMACWQVFLESHKLSCTAGSLNWLSVIDKPAIRAGTKSPIDGGELDCAGSCHDCQACYQAIGGSVKRYLVMTTVIR